MIGIIYTYLVLFHHEVPNYNQRKFDQHHHPFIPTHSNIYFIHPVLFLDLINCDWVI